jgi:hypothetical protein
VCWRIWGRKRASGTDYDDIRTEGTAVAGGDEGKVGGSVADDSSHMDRYTSPQVRPNAAANF